MTREVDVAFAPLGMADVAMQTSVLLDDSLPSGPSSDPSRFVVASHAAMLPYGAVLRLGLDRLVVPHVVVGALGLADAFVKIVDCDRLGAHVSEYMGASFHYKICVLYLKIE